MSQELEVGKIVLCTVERIEGTIVFVKIEGTEQQGSIILSEIAPGRIRNLRDYVVPKKKIICKVLRISQNGNIDLSLRRVTKKEQKEIRESYKQEKSYTNILRNVLGEKAKDTINKILEKEKVYDFLKEAKENPKKLEDYVGKEDSEKISSILGAQKQKRAIVKKIIFLRTTKPDGLRIIKKVLGDTKGAEIKHLSAGKYSIQVESQEIKTASNNLKEILSEIEQKAKKEGMEFEFKEK
jgi:translation initiation factor 2 alpha subunit (eIF-2alpha)